MFDPATPAAELVRKRARRDRRLYDYRFAPAEFIGREKRGHGPKLICKLAPEAH